MPGNDADRKKERSPPESNLKSTLKMKKVSFIGQSIGCDKPLQMR